MVNASHIDLRAAHFLIERPGASPDDSGRARVFRQLNDAYRTIKVHLTSACNLRCRNCYSDPHLATLAPSQILGLLDQLRGMPCRLDLLGGEPLSHPDLFDIIRYAKPEVGVSEIFLYTNGTQIDVSAAARLRDAGVDVAIVSLHAPEATVHETLTNQRGSFDRTCCGLDALVRAGLRTYTFTVVCTLNADLIPAMQRFAADHDAGALLFPYVSQHQPDALTIDDKVRARAALSGVIRAYYYYRASLSESLRRGCKLCRAFTRTVTVLADGTVTPCPFAAIALGNISDAPLYEILADSHGHPVLADFLSLPDECTPAPSATCVEAAARPVVSLLALTPAVAISIASMDRTARGSRSRRCPTTYPVPTNS